MTKLIAVSSLISLKIITENDQWMLNYRLALDSAAIFRFHYNTQTIRTLLQPLQIYHSFLPIAEDYQTRSQNPQPNMPTENVEVNPIYEYFVLFYRKINMAVLNCTGIKSSHIPFTFNYNRKFDWCLIVEPIWLVWHTYIADPLIQWTTRP